MKPNYLNLSPLWGVVLIYQLITIVVLGIVHPDYLYSVPFLSTRTVIIIYLIIRFIVKPENLKKYGILIDVLVFYTILSYLYGETAILNLSVCPKIDYRISQWDEWIFGFQPSVRFSESWNHWLFNELMYFGYFSYYLIPFISFLIIWKYKTSVLKKYSFLVVSSYFVYFLIYIIVPSEGPQFYFQNPLNQIEAYGPFGMMVKLIQYYGEAPTAAFPSSHVGVSVIILIVLYKYHKALFRTLLPFCIILWFSTVYIKAHYFVDVVAGMISAPIVLLFCKYLYKKNISLLSKVFNVN